VKEQAKSPDNVSGRNYGGRDLFLACDLSSHTERLLKSKPKAITAFQLSTLHKKIEMGYKRRFQSSSIIGL